MPPLAVTAPRTLAPLAACLALLAAPSAFAQTADPQTLTDVVVTATRTPEPVDRLVSDVTVIDAGPAAAGLSLADLLQAGAGVQLSRNGGPAATTGLFLRGANTGHTLTLIDGFRVGSASLGQTTVEALPVDHADRIEVLRGPASSLYGADAIGGVVQLLSREPQPGLAGFASAAIGQEGTRLLRGGLEGGDDRIRGRIRLGRDRSDGFDATTPGYFDHNPDRDGYRRDSASAQLEARLAPETRLRAIALLNRLETEFDNGTFDGARVKTRSEVLGLTASHAPDAITSLEAKIGRTRDRSESISSFPGTFDSTLTQFGLSGSRVLAPGITARLVLERLEEAVDADGYTGGHAERSTNSVGLLLSGDDGPHRLQAGVRVDDSNQYGDETHFNLAYGYRLGGGLRVGGSYATAFHAPSFNDLFFPGYGRLGIRPETARNAELGLWWNPPAGSVGGAGSGRWYGKAVAFQSKVKDLIVYAPTCPDPDPQFVFGCADNVERARIRGLSFEIGQRPGRAADYDGALATDRPTGLAWSLNLDLLDPKNETTGDTLARRARRQLAATVDYGRSDWRIGAGLVAASRRFDDAANLNPLGGYATVDLRAAWRLAPGFEAFGSITNVADRAYVTARHYRQQGRLMLVGVRYAMR